MQRMKKETPHNFTEHVFKKNWSMWWDGMWWDGILSAGSEPKIPFCGGTEFDSTFSVASP